MSEMHFHILTSVFIQANLALSLSLFNYKPIFK